MRCASWKAYIEFFAYPQGETWLLQAIVNNESTKQIIWHFRTVPYFDSQTFLVLFDK